MASTRKNPGLKSPNELLELTNEQIIEYVKCRNDPVYFTCNYIHIKHPSKGRVPFKMHEYQKEMMRMYQNNQYSIVLSARQTGKTETSVAYLLWYAIFHPDKTVLVCSNKSTGAMEIISRIQYAYEGLPHWLKPGINDANWNKHTCAFDNKSKIVATTTSKDSGRGLSISLLYSDECAFVPANVQEQWWDSILPTLSEGGSIIISSTPNGDINLFARLWRGAELGTNEFSTSHIHVKWDMPPGRDEKFKDKMIGLLGDRKWRQEYECEFLSSELTLIDNAIVSQAERALLKNPPTPFKVNNQLFWKKVNPQMTYIVAVDPGSGSGEDYSVIQVYEFPSMEQIMEFRSNTLSSPVLYTQLKNILKFLEQFTKEVYFSVENNGVGNGIISLYENDDAGPQNATMVSEAGKNKIGFTTTQRSKIKACLTFKNMFESGQLKVNSPIMLKEMKSYVRREGSYAAQVGATDDCIAATLIAIRTLEEMSTFDDAAYHKLYSFNLENQEEWEYDDKDEYSVPMPMLIT